MGYKPFFKQRPKSALPVQPHPKIRFKRRSWLARIIQRVLFGAPGQAVPKYRMEVYDYSPKHGLMPKSSVPFHSKLITGGVILTGLSIVWSLNEPSIAFYEPPGERGLPKQIFAAPDPKTELQQFATPAPALQDAVEIPQQAVVAPSAPEPAPAMAADFSDSTLDSEASAPLLNPISMEEVLESFSYPSNPLIQLNPAAAMAETQAVPVLGEETAEEENTLLPLPVALAEGEIPAQLAVGWQTLTIQSGDNLSQIFGKYGLDQNDLDMLLSIKALNPLLRKLQVGQQIEINIGDNQRVEGLKIEVSPTEELHISRDELGFRAEVVQRQIEVRQVAHSGRITTSLYSDGRKAGLDDALLRQMVKIFGYDIDFALDLQPGDRFVVIHEEGYYQGRKVSNGQIKIAEFINSGTVYRAVAYTNADGHTGYYTPEGEGLEKAFLRTPINIVNITSGFGSRMHPILNKLRAHKGVDYSAPTGTPVFASGSGKISFAGWKNGYGKTLIIDHGDQYQTVYAHLSKFEDGMKAGERVHQGDLVGYVGSTGLATGPHLHYEFLVDGEHKNPLSIVLPRSLGIPAEEKADFLARTQVLVAQLNQASNLAQAETPPSAAPDAN